ncbi:MAG TPA: hypothetical protein VER76_08315 [Pyrinomonadaceae bacterium]|nr:hypothetical protein [Pyrinomonadaceae bacterium]
MRDVVEERRAGEVACGQACLLGVRRRLKQGVLLRPGLSFGAFEGGGAGSDECAAGGVGDICAGY